MRAAPRLALVGQCASSARVRSRPPGSPWGASIAARVADVVDEPLSSVELSAILRWSPTPGGSLFAAALAENMSLTAIAQRFEDETMRRSIFDVHLPAPLRRSLPLRDSNQVPNQAIRADHGLRAEIGHDTYTEARDDALRFLEPRPR